MAKFLAQKKKLLEDIYEKASSETTEISFSGITKYLERTFKDDYKIQLSYKAFENYYKAIVKEENGDYNIKTNILDDLSKYLGYNTFKEYCSEWRTIEYSINHTISKIVINIVNKPLLTLPDFFQKKSNMGIIGIILLLGTFIGGVGFIRQKSGLLRNESITDSIIHLIGGVEPKKECMYWNDSTYTATVCEDKNPHRLIIPIDSTELNYFKKITRPDTLTIENALDKIWYSKRWNHVDFFTTINRKGTNPKNGATLRPVTETIIEKYAR
ncbi:hypothetical protein C8J95_106222 [Elizabethkingia sp. YR214]|uniref:hypothetical protein n=1 Tax=Elizabethkingia sp. YR214 TaxID=2135667 RepID=UPI000D315761|nr:hypothetical protein [Elizabethkingia sp. YR214]PUB29567.1 hypothetical protein C8J95_106222 [Elizabethkingia sp. YR214]